MLPTRAALAACLKVGGALNAGQMGDQVPIGRKTARLGRRMVRWAALGRRRRSCGSSDGESGGVTGNQSSGRYRPWVSLGPGGAWLAIAGAKESLILSFGRG
jgi:hypothetical protein